MDLPTGRNATQLEGQPGCAGCGRLNGAGGWSRAQRSWDGARGVPRAPYMPRAGERALERWKGGSARWDLGPLLGVLPREAAQPGLARGDGPLVRAVLRARICRSRASSETRGLSNQVLASPEFQQPPVAASRAAGRLTRPLDASSSNPPVERNPAPDPAPCRRPAAPRSITVPIQIEIPREGSIGG